MKKRIKCLKIIAIRYYLCYNGFIKVIDGKEIAKQNKKIEEAETL